MYVITGATGNTGKIVSERLLDAGQKVRVVGRSVERLQPLVDRGAEPFVANLNDTLGMARAFEGARAVYVLIPADFAASDIRAHQRAVTQSLVRALERSKVTHAVFLSSIGAHLSGGTGPIVGLHEAEQALDDLAKLSVLHLRPGYFMENLFGLIPTIKQAGVAGSPVRGDIPIAMIAARDIGEHAARRLLELDFSGRQVRELHGQRDLSLEEAARVLGRAIERPDLRYVQFGYADAEEGMLGAGLSQDMAALYTEMARGFNEGIILPEEPRSRENTTPTSIEDFAPMWAAAFRAS